MKSTVVDLQAKNDQVQRVARNGITATSTKEKQIGRLIDQVESYKKQLQEALDREVAMKKVLNSSEQQV